MNFKAMLQPVRFGAPEANGDIPRPLLRGQASRRYAAMREAKDVLAVLPGPGEMLHALMTGRYDLTDLIDVLLDRCGAA